VAVAVAVAALGGVVQPAAAAAALALVCGDGGKVPQRVRLHRPLRQVRRLCIGVLCAAAPAKLWTLRLVVVVVVVVG